MAVSIPPIIAAGQHVQLRLQHVGTLPATVESIAHATVAVVLAVPDTRVPRLSGTEVTVEWTTGRGIQRLLGRLEVGPNDGAAAARIAVHGDVERIQRREWARVEAIVPIRVQGIDENIGGETSTLNVSGGGVLLKDLWRMPLGLDVRIEIEVERDASRISALGRIVREAAIDQKGVRIDDIGSDDEARLVRFVRERERAALRMARGR